MMRINTRQFFSSIGTSNSKPSTYRAIFRLGSTVSSGVYKVYEGNLIQHKKLLFEKKILHQSGGSLLSLLFKGTDLPSGSSWITVKLDIIEAKTLSPKTYVFYFYHRALE